MKTTYSINTMMMNTWTKPIKLSKAEYIRIRQEMMADCDIQHEIRVDEDANYRLESDIFTPFPNRSYVSKMVLCKDITK